MQIIELSHNVLKQIVYNGLSFSLCLKNAAKKHKMSVEERTTLSSLVGCSLRHYYVFEGLIKKTYESYSDDQFLALLIKLSDHLFVKKAPEKEMINFVNKYLDGLDAYDFINNLPSVDALIPKEFDQKSQEFLSLRFNTPGWIVKTWTKQFGHDLAYKILKTNSKLPAPIFRVNPKISKADLFANHSEFSEYKIDNYVAYNDKARIGTNSAYQKGEVLGISCGLEYVINQVDTDPLRGIVYVGNVPSHVLPCLVLKHGNNFPIDIISDNQRSLFEIKQQINHLSLTKANVYECAPSSIIACVSKPVHTLFLMPENTEFSLLRTNPEYFLSCNQDKLDNLLSKQKESLDETANYVEKGGYLVYMINTISAKEGFKMIHRFVNEHPEFSVVNEKQLLPMDKYQTILYFAILRKEINND